MRRAVLLSLAIAIAATAVFSCGDDDASPSPADAGHDHAAPEDDVDSGPIALRCTDAELAAGDFTDGGVTITFERGANPRQYENHCATVRVGSEVRFQGSFLQHPLEPAGGDTPTPIPIVDKEVDGGALTIIPDRAGTYGYQCTFHATQMFGAIRVVP